MRKMGGPLGLLSFALCVALVGLTLSPTSETRTEKILSHQAVAANHGTTTTEVPSEQRVASVPTTSTVPVMKPASPSSPAQASAPEKTLVEQLASRNGASQVIIVDAPSAGSTTATMTAWEKSPSGWGEVLGPMDARTGWGGWKTSDVRHEGDGSSPIGIFGIGNVMYGVNPDPGGLRYPYHQLAPGDYWDENPSSLTYNSFQHSSNTDCAHNPFGGDTECLWTETTAYQYFAVIDFNPAPTTNPMGSGVFLHVGTSSATAGCISLSLPDLLKVLRWLNPAASPMIVEGPDDQIRSY